MSKGDKVFILQDTKVKATAVKAGEVVAVDKADYNTLVKIGRGVDPDTAEGKERIRQWREEEAERKTAAKKAAEAVK